MNNEDLGLIVLESHKELGEKINRYLQLIRRTDKDFRIPIITPRFGNGEGKGKIIDTATARAKDVYILTDTQNYSLTYKIRKVTNHMSPDDHYQDILRIISAISGHASRINVIMPFLYQSRQHKRIGKESLDCAMALRNLEYLKVNSILTVDVHDTGMSNVLPNSSFISYPPRKLLIDAMKEDYPNMDNIVVVAPDGGARSRANYVADKLINAGLGMFYKRRDLENIVDGRNKILQYEYYGSDLKDKNVIIVDDMISSGTSMLNSARYLKEHGANNIYIMVSFALFDAGIEEFAKAYEEGIFNKVYATNGSYIDEDVLNSEWFKVVDISEVMAEMISDMHAGRSLGKYLEK